MVVALMLAAGCASRAPVPKPAPPYGEAGRVVGGHLGTVVLAEQCIAMFPELAGEIGPALLGWRWRNDSVAATVESRMWAAVAERGATPAELAAAKVSFDRELQSIGAGMAEWFAGWPAGKQRAYCDRVTARLALGDDDLARRFPAEVRRWQGATR
jgi:hypothetical protein